MIVFLCEVFIESMGTQNYLLGFYFWLDLIASVSMVADIGWIWHRVIGIENVATENLADASQLARASKGAKMGTRAGRML